MKVIIIGMICILWVQKASSAPKWTDIAPGAPSNDDSEPTTDYGFMDKNHDVGHGTCTSNYTGPIDNNSIDLEPNFGNAPFFLIDVFKPRISAIPFVKIDFVYELSFDNYGNETCFDQDIKNTDDELSFDLKKNPNTLSTWIKTAILTITIVGFGWIITVLHDSLKKQKELGKNSTKLKREVLSKCKSLGAVKKGNYHQEMEIETSLGIEINDQPSAFQALGLLDPELDFSISGFSSEPLEILDQIEIVTCTLPESKIPPAEDSVEGTNGSPIDPEFIHFMEQPDWEEKENEEKSDNFEGYEITTTWVPTNNFDFETTGTNDNAIHTSVQLSESPTSAYVKSSPSLETTDLDLKRDKADGLSDLEPTYWPPNDYQELPLSIKSDSATDPKFRKFIDPPDKVILPKPAPSVVKDNDTMDFKNLSCILPSKDGHGRDLLDITDDQPELFELPKPGSTIQIVRRIFRKSGHDGLANPSDVRIINVVTPFRPISERSLRFHAYPPSTPLLHPYHTVEKKPLGIPPALPMESSAAKTVAIRDIRSKLKPKWNGREPTVDVNPAKRTSKKWSRDRLDGTLGGRRIRPDDVLEGSLEESHREKKKVTFSEDVSVRRLFLGRRCTFLAKILRKKKEVRVPLKGDSNEKPFKHLKQTKIRTNLILF